MSGEIPPGHLGNLTPEQEQKLLQLWEMLLKIFNEPVGDGQFGMRKASTASSVTTPKETKKKSRWWGGSSSSTKVDTPSDSTSSFAGLEGDDKWGMNKEFHNALQKYTPQQLQEAFYHYCKNEHPDVTALRFLRARKWDVNKAFVMLVSTLQFRLGMYKIDSDILRRGEGGYLEDSKSSDPQIKKTGTDFINLLSLGHSFIHGTDKKNRPVCYIRVKLHKIGAYAQSSVEKYVIWMIETARLMMGPNIETAAIVFDLTGFGLSNMDYTAVKFIIQCFEANYPESLGVVLVHKAPWIFSSAWALIKGWLDPVVASKIHFTKTDQDLLEYISQDKLLKDLGGNDANDYKYTPVVEGENKLMDDKASAQAATEKRRKLCLEYESLTRKWIETNKTEKEKDEALVKERQELGGKVVLSYWDTDPYVRARTVYDRLHLVKRPDEQAVLPDSKIANGVVTNGILEKNGVVNGTTTLVNGTQVN
ncbi:Cellular retinaldehyde-binding/triple function [Ascosphaera apis ARSEF 7405]|uniref:Cellular retinaldehyde-binding/triple function n=1 Tax=Ascosphaera apis ARSEF 7405 TaxID=392613 RepID=A0A168CUZ0_9EURO|nr:Cellular retinaldehyde-binding/triple function [Ascosphaera apis ARSEF 7405]